MIFLIRKEKIISMHKDEMHNSSHYYREQQQMLYHSTKNLHYSVKERHHESFSSWQIVYADIWIPKHTFLSNEN